MDQQLCSKRDGMLLKKNPSKASINVGVETKNKNLVAGKIADFTFMEK